MKFSLINIFFEQSEEVAADIIIQLWDAINQIRPGSIQTIDQLYNAVELASHIMPILENDHLFRSKKDGHADIVESLENIPLFSLTDLLRNTENSGFQGLMTASLWPTKTKKGKEKDEAPKEEDKKPRRRKHRTSDKIGESSTTAVPTNSRTAESQSLGSSGYFSKSLFEEESYENASGSSATHLRSSLFYGSPTSSHSDPNITTSLDLSSAGSWPTKPKSSDKH